MALIRNHCGIKGGDSTLKVGGGGGGGGVCSLYIFLSICIYQSLKRLGITLSWNKCA